MAPTAASILSVRPVNLPSPSFTDAIVLLFSPIDCVLLVTRPSIAPTAASILSVRPDNLTSPSLTEIVLPAPSARVNVPSEFSPTNVFDWISALFFATAASIWFVRADNSRIPFFTVIFVVAPSVSVSVPSELRPIKLSEYKSVTTCFTEYLLSSLLSVITLRSLSI